MDLATILGIVGSFAIVAVAIFIGGSFGAFVDIPSVLIVVGGATAAVLIRFSLSGVGGALVLGGKVAFTHKKVEPREMIEEITQLADIVRKSGPLGLENVDVSDPMLAKGAQYIADGYEAGFIRDSLERERDLYLERLEEGQRIFKAIGDSAPAFGMIGTLIGLVQMLGTMDDPSTIGPAMAVALLTTLYGALISNVIAIPINEKLAAKSKLQEVNLTLVIDGILQIRESKSPALIREMLLAYLPEQHRAQLAEAA